MKKKIYKFVSVAVIAVAMAVSFQMSKANNATDLTMENVEALAMADGEGNSDCPNGCLTDCGPGCECNGWHENLLEYSGW